MKLNWDKIGTNSISAILALIPFSITLLIVCFVTIFTINNLDEAELASLKKQQDTFDSKIVNLENNIEEFKIDFRNHPLHFNR